MKVLRFTKYFLFLLFIHAGALYAQRDAQDIYNSFDKALKNAETARGILVPFSKDNIAVEQLPEGMASLVHLSCIELNGFRNLDFTQAFSVLSQLPDLDTVILIDCGLERLGSEIELLSGIEYLRLKKYKQNSLPKEVGKLMNLKHLEIEEGSLIALPKEIGLLNNLEFLRIYLNFETISIPAEMCNLTNLKVLDFASTSIDALPDEIGNLIHLEKLGAGNGFSKIPPSVGNLKELKSITLINTKVKAVPVEFYNLTNLEYIDFHNNELTEIDARIRNFSKLRYLDLSGNVELKTMFDVSGIPALKTLDLSNTGISFIPPGYINADSIKSITLCPSLFQDQHQLNEAFGSKIRWEWLCRDIESSLIDFRQLYGKVETSLKESGDTLIGRYSVFYNEPGVIDEEYEESIVFSIMSADSIRIRKLYTIPDSLFKINYTFSSVWNRIDEKDGYVLAGYVMFSDVSDKYIRLFANIEVSVKPGEWRKVLYRTLDLKK